MKSILLFTTFILLSVLSYSQNNDLEKWANRRESKTSNNTKLALSPKSNLELAGEHLKKSSHYQYAAVGSTVASAGLV